MTARLSKASIAAGEALYDKIGFGSTKDAETLAVALSQAYYLGLEDAARMVEGHGGVIPGSAVFASLVSRNNMPDMSGDPRNRMHSHTRRDFDDATDALASEIRALGNK